MNALVLHNPDAGNEDTDRWHLEAAFGPLGFTVHYRELDGEDVDMDIARSMDLMVVAGGDGTLKRVFRRMADLGMTAPPIFIVPNGTANNIALSLGLNLDWRERVKGFADMVPRPFRYGRVTYGDQQEWFFESVGIGVFAEYLRLTEVDPDAAKRLRGGKDEEDFSKDLHGMAKLSKSLGAMVQLEVDSKRITSDVLWLEVLNGASMGPRLRFLDKDPQSGEGFSVVKIDSQLGKDMRAWLEQDAKGDVSRIGAEILIAKRVLIEGEISTFHVDDEFKDCKSGRVAKIEMELASLPLMILRE